MGKENRVPFSGYILLTLNFLAYLAYYTIKYVSKSYLKEGFKLSKLDSRYYELFFAAVIPFFHIVGVACDDFYGKLITTMISLGVYMLGILLIGLFSIDKVISVFSKFQLWSYLLPTALIMLGKGSLHPLMPSYISDQVLSYQVEVNDRIFALIYITTEVGRIVPRMYVDKLKYIKCFGYTCYLFSYSLALMFVVLATVLVYMFRNRYRNIPHPHEFLFYKIGKILVGATINYFRSKSRDVHSSFLKYYSTDHKLEHFYIDMRRLGQVIVVTLPLILYFSLVSQVEDTWYVQNNFMLHFNENSMFKYESMETTAQLLKLIFVFILTYFVYPVLYRKGKTYSPIDKITLGYILVLVASLISIILDYKVLSSVPNIKLNPSGGILSCSNCVQSIVQLPQWILYSLGEALLLPSALQYVSIASGDELKTTGIAIWIILTPLFGDRIADVIEGLDLVEINLKASWTFFICGLVGFLIYYGLAYYWYKELTPEIEEVGMNTKNLKHYARIN